MNESTEVHPIQGAIVTQLFARSSLRFAELNTDKLPSDQFSYHLKRLLKDGYITKDLQGVYRLSPLGKSRAILFNPAKSSFIVQGFIAIRLVISHIKRGGQKVYLVQHRSYEPFKGTYAVPGDKILYGESVDGAAKRIIQEQTGLDCHMEQRGLIHFKEFYEGSIVQDKYFFVFQATRPTGDLKPRGRKGKNLWLSREQLQESGKAIQGLLEVIDISESGPFTFVERDFTLNTY